ncbi:O-antigen/teichoic acid export membrane protein [Nonlabens ulvanivorans]|uniref:O-antigen/teichoic acid export membrane protein n=2 Tax=Nonlabens ulvanivorans TaxID=906888 RepID=A0ABX5E758_NONUL|nr:O-antigen/teichoic acid export membrane protein [Nonlabens ulvanivorans]
MILKLINLIKGKLFQSLGMYTLVNFINSAIPFLLLPILTSNLSEAEYGIVDIFNNLSFIFIPIIGLNIVSCVLRFYYDDNIDFNKFLSTVTTTLLICGTIIILAVASFIYSTDVDIINEEIPNSVLLLALLFAFSSQIIEIILGIFRATERPLNYGFVRIVKTGLDLSLSIYCVVVLKLGWEGRIYPAVGVGLLIALLILLYLFHAYNVRLVIKKDYLRIAFKYSTPLIFHSLAGYIISFSDRFIILEFMSAEDVGLYAVAYQVGMIMSFVNNSFNQAWTPYVFSILKGGDLAKIKQLSKFNYFYFLLMIVLALSIFLMVPLIYEWFIDGKFEVDYQIVFWVLLGYAFNGMYKVLVNYLFYYKRTSSLAIITVSAAVCNIVFCILLVPRIGILGASISTTIAFFLMFALVYVYYLKSYKIQKIK